MPHHSPSTVAGGVVHRFMFLKWRVKLWNRHICCQSQCVRSGDFCNHWFDIVFCLKTHVISQLLSLLHVYFCLIDAVLQQLLLLLKRLRFLIERALSDRVCIPYLVLLLARVGEKSWIYTTFFSLPMNLLILYVILQLLPLDILLGT